MPESKAAAQSRPEGAHCVSGEHPVDENVGEEERIETEKLY